MRKTCFLFAILVLSSSPAFSEEYNWRYFTQSDWVVKAFSTNDTTGQKVCTPEIWSPENSLHPNIAKGWGHGAIKGWDGKKVMSWDGIRATEAGVCDFVAIPWDLVEKKKELLSFLKNREFKELNILE